MSNETNRYIKDSDTSRQLEIPPLDKIDLLARQQGVGPVTNFDELLGDFWPEDETADEFISATREWNQEAAEGTES